MTGSPAAFTKFFPNCTTRMSISTFCQQADYVTNYHERQINLSLKIYWLEQFSSLTVKNVECRLTSWTRNCTISSFTGIITNASSWPASTTWVSIVTGKVYEWVGFIWRQTRFRLHFSDKTLFRCRQCDVIKLLNLFQRFCNRWLLFSHLIQLKNDKETDVRLLRYCIRNKIKLFFLS